MGEIFLKLLNMSITASWLILAVLCIRLVFRKIPKWVTCLLWGVVAIRLIFPFSIESQFSLQPSAEPIKSSTIVEGDVVPFVPSIDSNLGIVESTVNPVLAETFAYQETESVAPLQVFTGIAGSVWLCGMLALFIFAAVSMIRLRLSVREAVLYKENIYICDAVKSPFILGIVKPRIYFSSALKEEEMNYIIAHEMAHLRRKDHFWKPFGYLILCIYWFNPLCWIAYIMLCKDIELACDEKVIKDMSFGDKKEYSRVLLSCASQRRLVSVCPLAFGEVGVKERVKSVLNYKRPAFWITMTAVTVCVIVAICFLTNPSKEYQIRITIPAGSTEEIVYQEDFLYSDEEISPTGNKITISLGEGMGDTEVVLKPIEVKEENAYEPTYITPGMSVEMDAEKGAWFKIGVNMQNPTTEDIDVYVNVRNVEVRIAPNENTESENNVYGNVIAGLGDNEAYAFLDMSYDNMVLLTSDMIYDEQTEKQAAIYCDVYYPVDGEVKKIGTIMSSGTAYPVTFTDCGIFVASGHTVEKYVILEDGELYLEKGACEQFDETGNVTYISMTGEQENESTVQEYQAMVEEYGRSQIVHFSYGADGSVNEYFEKENVYDVQESETDMADLQRELERVVGNVGLENAYPWNNTVNFKSDADALIKMASDDSGRFEIYGIMSAKYGTYGLLLNDWIGGEQNWNLELVPWHYSGAPSSPPVLELDRNGKYIFAYVYQYEDGVPQWRECILDCGYDTGHMELISQEEYSEETEDTNEESADNTSGIIEENTEKSVEKTTMVDTSKISSIVVTNGNTGEKITLTAEDLAYGDLLKLYWQLDFTAEYEENTRVGYQYSMKLLDADGNKLQSVTPYKDGVTIDGIFFKYDNTGNDTVASLNLMEYLEYVCNPEQSPIGKPITEVSVNTLENVTMTMKTYNSCEGDIEITNESGSEIGTGEWYSIQRYEDGEWHRMGELIDGIWKEVEYRIPNGETPVFPTNWKTWYGQLPSGQYRIVKEVYYHSEERIDTYYLSTEFEIN